MKEESSSYKIVIPEEVERKIRFYCSNISTIEWSGILFYTVSGSFEGNDLVITCKDIYLMDIGTAGYTEFNMSPEVAGYMAENIELCDCFTGLVHSHNSMPTFFSGTDTHTLNIEGNDRNHFVSLIVNNAGIYTAAITRKIEYIITKGSYSSFDNKQVSLKVNKKVTDRIEYFNLKVEVEGSNLSELESRLSVVKAKKASTITTSNSPYNSYIPKGSYGDWDKENDDYFYGNHDWKPYNNTIAPRPGIPTVKQYGAYGINKEVNKGTQVPVTNKTAEDPELTEEEILQTALKQLITGSIVLSSDSKLDVNKWAESSMIPIFDKRFGNSDVGLEAFKRWATDHVDFILWDLVDMYGGDDNTSTDDDLFISNYAISLISMLNRLPNSSYNKYIKSLIDIIDGYN